MLHLKCVLKDNIYTLLHREFLCKCKFDVMMLCRMVKMWTVNDGTKE